MVQLPFKYLDLFSISRSFSRPRASKHNPSVHNGTLKCGALTLKYLDLSAHGVSGEVINTVFHAEGLLWRETANEALLCMIGALQPPQYVILMYFIKLRPYNVLKYIICTHYISIYLIYLAILIFQSILNNNISQRPLRHLQVLLGQVLCGRSSYLIALTMGDVRA